MRRVNLMPSLLIAAVILILPSALRADDQADNPQFTAWTKFAVGSSASYQLQVQAQGQTIGMSLVQKLDEKTDDHIVIETTTIIDAGGVKTPTPARKQTIPSKSSKMAIKDLGTENVTAGGKTYSCLVRSLNGASIDHPDANVKAWTNAGVPGGVVKMELTTARGSISQILTDFEAK